jgi:DNA-directed RNA polymerase subunit RPC12/RpoP
MIAIARCIQPLLNIIAIINGVNSTTFSVNIEASKCSSRLLMRGRPEMKSGLLGIVIPILPD